MTSLNLKVLVVDDDPLIEDLYEVNLRKAGCTDLQFVHCRDSAIGYLKDQRPDMILMDTYLPGAVRGYAVCGDVWELYADLPIVGTSETSTEEVQASWNHIGVPFVNKSDILCPRDGAMTLRTIIRKTIPGFNIPEDNYKGPVVILEDTIFHQHLLNARLSAAGYESIHFVDTYAGLVKKVREHNPDLIILDTNVGNELGSDACKALRQREHSPARIIGTSGTMANASLWVGTGADAFVDKMDLLGITPGFQSPERLRDLLENTKWFNND